MFLDLIVAASSSSAEHVKTTVHDIDLLLLNLLLHRGSSRGATLD